MSALAAFAPGTQGGTLGPTTSLVMATGAPTSVPSTITTAGYFNTVMVTNPGTVLAFVAVATKPYTATAADVPVLPNNRMLLASPQTKPIYVAAIPAATLAAATSIFFTIGEGGEAQS
jgi:hypothetical protein